MSRLNFKHLRYFWAVARSGSIARASGELHVTAQSISSQLRELEGSLGTKLLQRAGRGLELTESGRRILSYADEIFSLGDELVLVAREHGARPPLVLRVGVADSVPKTIAYRVVEPALHLADPVRLVCREGRLASLLAELALHRLDLVIADRPLPADINVRGYNHLLGASDLTVFAADAVARALPKAFPALLEGAPLLLPGEGVAIRPRLEQWLEARGLHPRVVGEFDDSGLMKAFGQGGAGLFVAPTAIRDDVCRQYGVRAVGRIGELAEHLYAITTERVMRHPAAVAIREAAQRDVFGAARRDARPEPARRARVRSRAAARR